MLDAPPEPARPGRIRRFHTALDGYEAALEARFGSLDLSGMRLLLDCANGATYEVAPALFRRLGADVDVLAAEPDGRNINAGCGSTHIDSLADAVREGGHDAGFAFDGDGDRVLAVDRNGVVVDGDELIALAAVHLGVEGVAVTVMTNYGFHTGMRAAGSRSPPRRSATATCSRSCAAAAGRSAASSPGTSSSAASCPPATASPRRCSRSSRSRAPTSPTATRWRSCRRRSSTCACATATPSSARARVQEAVERESAALEGRGRVLLRPSGTEPLVRVMVEAPTADEADAVCGRLVELVESELA